MNEQELIGAGLAAFDQLVAATPGFQPRPGQRTMAQSVAMAFARGSLGQHADPVRAIHVVQAGTGVGKSAGYASVGVAMAKARNTRLVISTATVSLQEQLLNKDLPQLAATMTQPFTFARAVGRARYVCLAKLHRLGGAQAQGGLLGEDEDEPAGEIRSEDAQAERRVTLHRTLTEALASGWAGDMDSLTEQPEPGLWSQVAADRHTCTARACTEYSACRFYAARATLANADVIVANHDLVLASIGSRALPELDDCLIVFDEAHRLPACGQDQFTASLDLGRQRWLDKLPGAMSGAAAAVTHSLDPKLGQKARELKATLGDITKLIFDALGSVMRNKDGVHRFAHGLLPEFLDEPLRLVSAHATSICTEMAGLSEALRDAMKEKPEARAGLAQLYASVGAFAPRVEDLIEAADMLLTHEGEPLAKWVSAETRGGFVGLQLSACPLTPNNLLASKLWSRTRAAVLTSATLTACGSFGYFLGVCGLEGDPAVRTVDVQSPFNYAEQGELVVVQTRSNAKQVEAYTREVAQELAQDLKGVTSGALVLATSRAQLSAVVESLPENLREHILVQGTASRERLIARHRERVRARQPSILMGLQSFGEGLDLPGKECETLMLLKLPFPPPSDPVAEALAEHVRAQGGDPFDELVVPATGVTLQQWTGRGIRTVNDRVVIIVYDKRLTAHGYGRRILRGLPAYPVRQRQPRTAALVM